jgi:DNA-binding MarR family transcriptional regulator
MNHSHRTATPSVTINDTPGLDQNSLAERMALDRTSISALVFRLEQQGLIERAVNGDDRRARVLRLSRAGRILHDRLRPKP